MTWFPTNPEPPVTNTALIRSNVTESWYGKIDDSCGVLTDRAARPLTTQHHPDTIGAGRHDVGSSSRYGGGQPRRARDHSGPPHKSHLQRDCGERDRRRRE